MHVKKDKKHVGENLFFIALLAAFIIDISGGMPSSSLQQEVQKPSDIGLSTSKGPPSVEFKSEAVPLASESVAPVLIVTEDHTKAIDNDNNVVNTFTYKLNKYLFNISSTESIDKTDPLRNIHTIVWSPLSIYQALLPLLFASDGETLTELRTLLTSTSTSTLNSDSKSFGSNLDSVSTNKALTFTTGLFSRDDLPLNPDYLKDLQEQLRNVQVKPIDFGNAEKSLEIMNSWVRDSTQGLISEALSKDQIDPEMLMMIVNCVRFKAPWQVQFNKDETRDATFHGVSGPQTVQMMNQRNVFKLGRFPIINSIDEFNVLEMPYASDLDIVSLFILPQRSQDIPATLSYISELGIDRLRNSLFFSEVDVSIPKFKLTTEIDMKDVLSQYGLRTLFTSGEASLSKMFTISSPEAPLSSPYVSKIVHRTIFETSEEGTTAGATTSLSLVPLSALINDKIYNFVVDRPFIILLIKNDTIIFEGVISNLKGQSVSSEYLTDIDEMTQDRTWWIPQRIPEYLKLNNTAIKNQTSKSNQSVGNDNETIKKHANEDLTKAASKVVPVVASTPPLKPNEFIQFSSKYQQPEPKDPEGIRFPVIPASNPQRRNKVNFKPRRSDYDYNNDYLRQWMNIF